MPIKKSTIIKYMNFQYSKVYTKYHNIRDIIVIADINYKILVDNNNKYNHNKVYTK